MQQRLNYFQVSPTLAKQYLDFNMALKKNPFLQEIEHLVTIRASQINGCAFCLDMHVKEAKLHGERELRVHHLSVWRESPLFTPRERAVLTWTEALTRLPADGVSSLTYEQVRSELSEEEISDLSFLVIAINGWNRLAIGFQAVPGSADTLYGLDKAGLN